MRIFQMPKNLTQADYDLLKARGKVVNGFTTNRGDDFVPTQRFPKFKFNDAPPTSSKNQLIDKVHEIFDKADTLYNTKFERPFIKFKKRGKVAGTANSNSNTLNFNMVLFNENTDHFLNQTVTHECAHLIANTLYNGWKKVKSHGVQWKSVMLKLGCTPNRCHSYDTSNSTVYQKAKFVYKCSCQTHVIGAVRHKRSMRGTRYSCNACKKRLTFVKAVGKVTREKAMEMA
jgi:SprT protein